MKTDWFVVFGLFGVGLLGITWYRRTQEMHWGRSAIGLGPNSQFLPGTPPGAQT